MRQYRVLNQQCTSKSTDHNMEMSNSNVGDKKVEKGRESDDCKTETAEFLVATDYHRK